MLVWVVAIILIILVAAAFLTKNIRNYDVRENTRFLCVFLSVLVTVTILVMSGVSFTNHIGIEGDIAAYNARYESLVYQLENDIYENDNDFGKRDLMLDIERWNADLAEKKADQYDFWIGVFVPNIYDEFEFIELR